jgi:hypothetical protein
LQREEWERFGAGGRTAVDEVVVAEDAEREADQVDEEVPVVVDADAVVDPRAVAGLSVSLYPDR